MLAKEGGRILCLQQQRAARGAASIWRLQGGAAVQHDLSNMAANRWWLFVAVLCGMRVIRFQAMGMHTQMFRCCGMGCCGCSIPESGVLPEEPERNDRVLQKGNTG